jgi:hypothetical protein
MSLESLTGGGGLSGSSAADSKTGNLSTGTATGAKNINIGGNPNIASLTMHPVLIVGAVILGIWAWRRFK